MQPSDVVILGSDGRDDIIMGDGEARVVNQDEEAFLRHVEQGRGALHAMVRSLMASGELMDDLSLMRLVYREDAPSPPGRSQELVRFLRQCALALRAGKLDEAEVFAGTGTRGGPRRSPRLEASGTPCLSARGTRPGGRSCARLPAQPSRGQPLPLCRGVLPAEDGRLCQGRRVGRAPADPGAREHQESPEPCTSFVKLPRSYCHRAKKPARLHAPPPRLPISDATAPRRRTCSAAHPGRVPAPRRPDNSARSLPVAEPEPTPRRRSPWAPR